MSAKTAYTPSLLSSSLATSSVSPSPLVVRFRVDKEHIRKIEVEPGVVIYHIYPTLSSWKGQLTPDSVNPRSHEAKTISSGVPKAIEETLQDHPEDFYLANRGETILAEKLSYDPERQLVEIILVEYEGEEAIQGLADGGTTDAVIGLVQKAVAKELGLTDWVSASPEQIPSNLHQSRLHLEVIVGLEDRDRISRLVQGRNTSRQVKTWSINDFKGEFKWIKEVLDAPGSPFKGKIGYEENAGKAVTILEVLAILTLFHRDYDSTNKAPTVAYSSKGRMDSRVTDEKTEPGYRALGPLLKDVLELHDYVYAGFQDAYKRGRPGGRLGKWGTRDEKIFPKKSVTLPLTGKKAQYQVPSGVLYPLLGAFRALVQYDTSGRASWRIDPFEFFEEYGAKLVETLMSHLDDAAGNPQTLGKRPTAYNALYNQAKLDVGQAETQRPPEPA